MLKLKVEIPSEVWEQAKKHGIKDQDLEDLARRNLAHLLTALLSDKYTFKEMLNKITVETSDTSARRHIKIIKPASRRKKTKTKKRK